MAVNASAKLWTVSASRATDPEVNATAAWSRPVTSRATKLSLSARNPRPLDSSAESIESEVSWLCGRNTDSSTPRHPDECSCSWSCAP